MMSSTTHAHIKAESDAQRLGLTLSPVCAYEHCHRGRWVPDDEDADVDAGYRFPAVVDFEGQYCSIECAVYAGVFCIRCGNVEPPHDCPKFKYKTDEIIMNSFPQCKHCKVSMTKGEALLNSVSAGVPDFPGVPVGRGQTLSYNGPAKMVEVWKCPACGHSFSEGTEGLE